MAASSDTIIDSFASFRAVTHRYRSSSWVFRGVSNSEYALIPKVGRPPLNGEREEKLFSAFCRGAVAFVDLPRTELGKLGFAQHHGLPTRLLDWSENPLVAAYFATASSPSADGAIYIVKAENVIDDSEAAETDPFAVTEVTRYYPPHVTPRITAQRGLFTIHPDPTIPLSLSDAGPVRVHRAIIAKDFKARLRYDLSRYHIHSVSLFPDVDGLAQHLIWTYSNSDPYEDPRA